MIDQFEDMISQALEVANGGVMPDSPVTERWTRLADFTALGTDQAPLAPVGRANIVSATTGRRHRQAPVLDLDVCHTYVPSDTPGHAHLYLDDEMHDMKVLVLMAVLRWTGVIERGHWRGYLHRGYSAVRLPWVRKHHA